MTTPLPEPRYVEKRGSAWKEGPKGGLFLDFHPWRILALRPSPPIAWRLDQPGQGRWRGDPSPAIDLHGLLREIRLEDAAAKAGAPPPKLSRMPYHVRRRQNLRRFFAHIEPAVLDELALPWSYGGFSLLRVLARDPRALELCAAGDRALVLGVALASIRPPSQGGERRPRLAETLRWLGRPRKEICARLGFPARKATAAVLRRAPIEELGAPLLDRLHVLLAHDEVSKRLWHAPRVSLCLVTCLDAGTLPHLAPSLLDELGRARAEQTPAWQVRRDLDDTLALCAQLQPERHLVLGSLAELAEAHTALVSLARLWAACDDEPLPPPPVRLREEETWVRPLRTLKEMLEEGQRMQHCLGTLHSQRQLAKEGLFCAWALEGAERATIALVRAGVRSPWSLWDLRGFANAIPSDGLRAWARSFVARANSPRRSFASAGVEGRQEEMILDGPWP